MPDVFYRNIYIYTQTCFLSLYVYTCLHLYINKYIERDPFPLFFFSLLCIGNDTFIFSELLIHLSHYCPDEQDFFNCLNYVNDIKLYYCPKCLFFYLHLNSKATSIILLQMEKMYLIIFLWWVCCYNNGFQAKHYKNAF